MSAHAVVLSQSPTRGERPPVPENDRAQRSQYKGRNNDGGNLDELRWVRWVPPGGWGSSCSGPRFVSFGPGFVLLPGRLGPARRPPGFSWVRRLCFRFPSWGRSFGVFRAPVRSGFPLLFGSGFSVLRAPFSLHFPPRCLGAKSSKVGVCSGSVCRPTRSSSHSPAQSAAQHEINPRAALMCLPGGITILWPAWGPSPPSA